MHNRGSGPSIGDRLLDVLKSLVVCLILVGIGFVILIVILFFMFR